MYHREFSRRHKEMSIFSMDYHIDLSDVDFNRKLKLSTLFSYFQDTASLASEDLGFGIDKLDKEYGVAWILMKIRVEIERMPILDEKISIETWPLEPKKLEFERDYVVRDYEGNVIIRAVSSWIIMDLKERKLRRSNTFPITYPIVRNERAIECKLGKLKNFGQLEIAYQKVIGYSDVDFNEHLNNSKYVDYIMDCFMIDEHKKYQLKSIEVHFTNEALPGDTITLQKDTYEADSGLIFIQGINEKDQKIVFKSQIYINKN